MKLTPAASTSTSASPSFGSGRATSSRRSASAPPGAAIRTVFMPEEPGLGTRDSGLADRSLPLCRDLRRHVAPGVPRLFHRPLVLDRRDVARLLAEGDRFQDSPHDLAAPGLRQHVHEVQLTDDGDRPELLPDGVEE